MSRRKNTAQEKLRKQYPLYIEIGLTLALAVLIFTFRIDMTSDDDFEIVMPEQEQIEMEEILQTDQVEVPPPPPKPPVPIEVPNDEVLEDEALNLDASLDLDAPVESAPPPPPPEEEEEEEETEPEIFVIVEQMPELQGGLTSIQSKIKYPEIARKAGVEGRVIVQFIVNEQGQVENPEVVRGIGAGCDEEAIRAVQTAQFTPGMQRGQPVKVRMSLPIIFRLR
ncbi:MAG: energy transducer TonB [Candidatus Paceibacterota bacterium]